MAPDDEVPLSRAEETFRDTGTSVPRFGVKGSLLAELAGCRNTSAAPADVLFSQRPTPTPAPTRTRAVRAPRSFLHVMRTAAPLRRSSSSSECGGTTGEPGCGGGGGGVAEIRSEGALRRGLWPRRGGSPVPPGWGCAAAASGARADAAVTVHQGPPGASGGGGGLDAANPVTGRAGGPSAAAAPAGAGSGGACNGNAWVIGAGSQPAAGWTVSSSARSWPVVGRCSGSLARQRSTSGRSSAGRSPVAGGVWTTR